jgi:hypothetical protein
LVEGVIFDRQVLRIADFEIDAQVAMRLLTERDRLGREVDAEWFSVKRSARSATVLPARNRRPAPCAHVAWSSRAPT